jgi:hypothetical protein
MRFFSFKWVGQTNPSRLLINILKYFRFWFRIRRDIWLFVHSGVYYQYMNRFRFVPCILSIRTDSFRVFSVYEQQNLVRRFISFRVFSVYEQILSVYSQYTNRFIPRILSIRTDSFRVFGECTQIILNIWDWIIFIKAFKGYYFKKSMCVCNWTEDLQGIIDHLALAWQKNFFPRILIIHGMTFQFKYFGEFEFLFEN